MADTKKHFLAEIEEQLLKTWEEEKTFEKSLKNRHGGERFNFYDGPPFANGVPHYGHLVQTTIKDSVTRYKTMRGYYVPRRVGWDTHGLPVEYAIEKEQGFKGKKDIEDFGIDKFNELCRQSVFKYKDVWEDMFKRVGRWADFEKSYATLDEKYIESVWWVFKSLYDKGLIYKDFRSAPYCPRCATPLSNFELNQGYQDGVQDPSLYVKFKLTDEEAFLVGWTTTPWSLPGNAAVAVNPAALYVYVTLEDDEGSPQTLVVAKNRLSVLNAENYQIIKEVNGRELAGKSYEPLFELSDLAESQDKAKLYKIWTAGFVSIEDGSGLLHVAPAFGEDDLNLAQKEGIPILRTIDESGHVVNDAGLPEEFVGKFFKTADKFIIENLSRRRLAYAAEIIEHTYPFCWRCDTPLLYYATDSWLVSVTTIKDGLVTNNRKIDWTPEHIRDGRFGKWLENVRDWAISRNRFWGAPIPIWATEDGEVVVIGSVEELKKRAINPEKVQDLHRPYVDDIEIKTDSGKVAQRIPEVFDCWFESGSMPYAQDHYPFEDDQQWQQTFPADFIAEAVDQTRGWFYTLHVLATALFDKPAFQNAVCSGWIVAADGEKLSKRKKNYAPMDEVFDQYGVDTLRFFMASSPIVNGEDVRFSVDFLRDVQRNVFMGFNNIYTFYRLYADVDGWQPGEGLTEPSSDHILDRWMLSRLNQTIGEVSKAMEGYRLDKATRPIAELIGDTSNWYVRRSRRRFWKAEDDKDKQQAYQTLHYVLLRTAQLLAPFSPFLADHIWRQLTSGTGLPESVHLSDWPGNGSIEQETLDDMAQARIYINEGLSQRAQSSIKVRQPLRMVRIPALPDEYKDIIAEELNVKEVTWTEKPADAGSVSVALDTEITEELKAEGLMRELVRQVQSTRKKAGLKVDDRILLKIDSTSTDINKAFRQYNTLIYAETLAIGELDNSVGYTEKVSINGEDISISLAKAPTD